ncbi:cytochrome P450 1A1-like [Montipora foliosa]|uniref:cytochrome P450 1A1-like n=1 Tax=Montipora foliosa TaxID=591990 RepID=UPI0035F164C0
MMKMFLEDFSLLGQSLFLCSLVLVLYFAREFWRRKFSKLPPGPWGLPLIGAIFRVGKNPHLDFTEMAKEYGDVFSLMLGNRLVVVINGEQAIQETVIKHPTAFAGRPKLYTFQLANRLGNSLVLTDYSPRWRICRKMSVAGIKDFVKNTQILEEKLLLESQRLVRHLQQQKDGPVDALMSFKCATANVIIHALFGVQRSYDDEGLRKILDLAENFGKSVNGSSLVDFLPLLKYFPNNQVSNLVLTMNTLLDVVSQMFKKNKESYVDNRVRNIADSFLRVVKKESEKASAEEDTVSVNPVLSDEDIISVLGDLFGAAFDTSSTTLYWGLAYLIKHPDIQLQLHDELDRVIGRRRLPTLQDIPSLPLLQATVFELLRVTSVVPLSIPRSTTAETNVREFIIPKDTVVFINLWSAHRNPDIWKDPDIFEPRRFLNSHGQLLDPRSLGGFMPFSAGRRRCPGETLATRALSVFLAVLLHSFHFTQDGLPAKYQGINFQGHSGLLLAAEKFFVKIIERS